MSAQENSRPVMASAPLSPSPGPLREDILRIAQELSGFVHDHLELATLEARLSVNTAVRMAIIAVVTAAMIASAWLALIGAAALGLISLGLAPVLALLLLAAINLLLALAGWWSLRQQSHSLGWPITMRLLKPRVETERDKAVP